MSNVITNSYTFVQPCVESDYQNSPVTSSGGGRTIEGTSRAGVGFQINSGHVLEGKKILRVVVKLDNDNRTPDATLSVRLRNSSFAIVGTFNQMDATGLTTSPTEYTFGEGDGRTPAGVAVQSSTDDMITVEYADTGDAIQIRQSYTTESNYVTNASTLYATSTAYNSWSTWQDGYSPYYYYWYWLECVYCA